MTGGYYVFRNAAGRLLKVVAPSLLAENADLAKALLPVPPEDCPAYEASFPEEARYAFSREARAWIFYPSRLDRMMTRFSVVDGKWWVEKRIFSRAAHPYGGRFVQLELPPAPVWRGRCFVEDGVMKEKDLRRFFDLLLKTFSLKDGLLPENAFDAVPRNCIVEDDGTVRFYDLEYAMPGGVPLSFLVYRTLKADVVRGGSRRSRRRRLQAAYEDWCGRLSVPPEFVRDERLSKAFKRFMTGGWRRRTVAGLLSLCPSRKLRARLSWWSDRVAPPVML